MAGSPDAFPGCGTTARESVSPSCSWPSPLRENHERKITMFDIHRVELDWGGRKLTLETGKVARQADGAVIATYGETTVIATVVAAKRRSPASTSCR